jgi:hypothetical protein
MLSCNYVRRNFPIKFVERLISCHCDGELGRVLIQVLCQNDLFIEGDVHLVAFIDQADLGGGRLLVSAGIRHIG